MKSVKNLLAISLVIICICYLHFSESASKTAVQTMNEVKVLFWKFDEIINDNKSEDDEVVNYAGLFKKCEHFVDYRTGKPNYGRDTLHKETVDVCARGVWYNYMKVFHERDLWKGDSGNEINGAIIEYFQNMEGNNVIPIEDLLHKPSKRELRNWGIIE